MFLPPSSRREPSRIAKDKRSRERSPGNAAIGDIPGPVGAPPNESRTLGPTSELVKPFHPAHRLGQQVVKSLLTTSPLQNPVYAQLRTPHRFAWNFPALMHNRTADRRSFVCVEFGRCSYVEVQGSGQLLPVRKSFMNNNFYAS